MPRGLGTPDRHRSRLQCAVPAAVAPVALPVQAQAPESVPRPPAPHRRLDAVLSSARGAASSAPKRGRASSALLATAAAHAPTAAAAAAAAAVGTAGAEARADVAAAAADETAIAAAAGTAAAPPLRSTPWRCLVGSRCFPRRQHSAARHRKAPLKEQLTSQCREGPRRLSLSYCGRSTPRNGIYNLVIN